VDIKSQVIAELTGEATTTEKEHADE